MDEKIADKLQGKNKAERAKIKARELAKQRLPNTFTKRGIQVTVVGQPTYERDCIKVELTARRGNKDIPINNPVYFANPPILVPTGRARKQVDVVTGQEFDAPEYEENPQEALRENIVQTIERIAERKGV